MKKPYHALVGIHCKTIEPFEDGYRAEFNAEVITVDGVGKPKTVDLPFNGNWKGSTPEHAMAAAIKHVHELASAFCQKANFGFAIN